MEISLSFVIRWFIRFALIYAVITLARSIRAQKEEEERRRKRAASEVAQTSSETKWPRNQCMSMTQRTHSSLSSWSMQDVNEVMENVSKPTPEWQATKAKTPVVPVKKIPDKVKPKTERDRREEYLQILRHHSRPVTWVCFNKNGTVLYSCGKDSLVVAWTLQTTLRDEEEWQIHAAYTEHRGAVWCCAVTDDDALLCTCGTDNKVLVWSTSEQKVLATIEVEGILKFCEWRVNRIKESSPTVTFCNNSFAKKVPARIYVAEYHPGEIKVLYAIAPESNCTQVRWTSEELLVSAHEDGKVVFWRMAEKLYEIDNGAKLSKIAIWQDMIACALLSGELKVWTYTDSDAEELLSIENDRPLNDVCTDGDNFVIGGGQDASYVALVGYCVDKEFTPMMFRGTENGLVPHLKGRFKNHFGPIHSLAFSKKFLASGSEDGLVHVELLT